MKKILLLCTFFTAAALHAQTETTTEALNAFVDQWHLSASKADSAQYFGSFYNDQSIFQGTDGSEYWTASEFREWAAPYFRRESAWTFEAFERYWYRQGEILWFNERLNSPHMGICRGVGIVQLRRWTKN